MKSISTVSSRLSLLFKSSAELEREQNQTIVRYGRILGGSQGCGFFDWDLKAQRIHWDGDFWETLGYGPRDLKALIDPYNFPDFLHKEDLAHLDHTVQSYLNNVGSGVVSARIKKKTQGYIWAEFRLGAKFLPDGRARFLSGIVLDVSRVNRAEEALVVSEARNARIIEALNDGLWEWSAEQGGFSFSHRCWEQIGFPEKDEDNNRGVDMLQDWRRRIHPDDVHIYDEGMINHIEHKQPYDLEYRVFGRDNQLFYIRSRGQMSYDAEGNPVRMSGTNMNVTELALAQQALRQAKEEAENANRAKSAFLSSMSHELRTPLNAILGYSQLFEREPNLTPVQKDQVAEISRAGQHLLHLIGEVLDLAKIEAGHMTLSIEPLSAVKVVNEAIGLIKEQANERGIKISVINHQTQDLLVLADRVRLSQVLLNLVSNAVKYNKDHGSINVLLYSPSADISRIEVKDTGRGIAKELHHCVFQPFNRVGAEGSNIEGTGVGLVVTKELVDLMGGAVGFTSIENQGSCFWVELPIANQSDRLSPHSMGALNPAAVTGPLAVGNDRTVDLQVTADKRILYIEDNESNRRLMEQILVRFDNLSLQQAEDGFSGLYQARTARPDLIILDIDLPGISGYDVVSILKSDIATRHIPVVALTANAMTHEIEKGRVAGFDRYLTKPININALMTVLNEQLS